MKVTSHDVARLAGVSRATVSLVLNRSESVALSPATRERVFKAASDLGYQPNSAARMLVRGDTETIGLVISGRDVLRTDGFVPQLLFGISEANRDHGYHVLIEGLGHESEQASYENLVRSRRIDGLIVLNPATNDPELHSLIESGFPVVIAGTVDHAHEHSVNFSTGHGMTQAAQLLAALGHRHIGMVTFSPPGLVATDTRIAAVRRALAERGIALDDDSIATGNFSAQSGAEATRALLTRQPGLTAIFAGNDTIAIGVISAAESMGRAVPNDLSVIGFDDLPFAAYLRPRLTTIRIDAVEQGRLAARMLINRLKKRDIAEARVVLPARLIARKSCAPAP